MGSLTHLIFGYDSRLFVVLHCLRNKYLLAALTFMFVFVVSFFCEIFVYYFILFYLRSLFCFCFFFRLFANWIAIFQHFDYERDNMFIFGLKLSLILETFWPKLKSWSRKTKWRDIDGEWKSNAKWLSINFV